MGLLGLRRFIDASGCTHVVRQPFDENEEEEIDKKYSSSFSSSSTASPPPSSYSYSSFSDCRAGGKKMKFDGRNQAKDEDGGSTYSFSSSFSKKRFQHGEKQWKNAGPYEDDETHRKNKGDSSSFSSNFNTPHADHVLIDLNCIIHSCLHSCIHTTHEGGVGGGAEKEMVIQSVLSRLEILLTTVIIPAKTLTICLDGPPPLAKIQTQRLRRRKLIFMNSGTSFGNSSSSSSTSSSNNNSDCSSMRMDGGRGSGGASDGGVNALAITAGSLFLVELENRIAAEFKRREGYGFLLRRCPVFLHGSTVAGEGENKISRALAYLAYGKDMDMNNNNNNRDEYKNRWSSSSTRGGENFAVEKKKDHQRDPHHSSGRRNQCFLNDGPPSYNPNDSVILIGHDIDLVLTCVGATWYHNISVLSPTSLQCVHVGEMLYRWWSSSNRHLSLTDHTLREKKDFSAEALTPLRVDFIFLFLLNGGDHYEGAGDVASALWRRYLSVRNTSVSLSRNKKKTKKNNLHHHSNNSTKLCSSSSASPQEGEQDENNASEDFFFSLVQPTLNAVNINVLADVVQADTYTGEADPEIGIQLVQSALWSLKTIVTGACPDYRYIPPLSIEAGAKGGGVLQSHPTVSHLRAAVKYCQEKGKSMEFSLSRRQPPKKLHHKNGEKKKKANKDGEKEQKVGWAQLRESNRHNRAAAGGGSGITAAASTFLPLTPLEHYVALMPTLAAMPRSIAETLQGGSFPKGESILTILLSSNDVLEIAGAAEQAVEASSAALRPCERHLRQLTSPVQLNVLPPRVHLSRHAQHRLLKIANTQLGKRGAPPSSSSLRTMMRKMRVNGGNGNGDRGEDVLRIHGGSGGGSHVFLEDPEPIVRLITMAPEDVPVINLEYPPYVKGLRFSFPFSALRKNRGEGGQRLPHEEDEEEMEDKMMIGAKRRRGNSSAEGMKKKRSDDPAHDKLDNYSHKTDEEDEDGLFHEEQEGYNATYFSTSDGNHRSDAGGARREGGSGDLLLLSSDAWNTCNSSAEGKILYLSSFYRASRQRREEGKKEKELQPSRVGKAKAKDLVFSSTVQHEEKKNRKEEQKKISTNTTWGALEHKLAVARRLKEKGARRTATGTKMRRALRRVQTEVSEALRRAAAAEDWKYKVKDENETHTTTKKKHKKKLN